MDYTFEKVSTIFGVFYVVYENEGEPIERVVYQSRDIEKALKVYKTLRG